MRWSHLAVVLFALASRAAIADEAALAEQLTRELDEKLYAHLAGPFSQVLKAQYLTSRQVDYRIRTAARQHAECAVARIRDQAEEDGRSAEAVLQATTSDALFEQEIGSVPAIEGASFSTRVTLCGRFWLAALEETTDMSDARVEIRVTGFTVGGTQLLIQPPDDFLPVTDTKIANASGNTRISVEIKDKDISGVDMDRLRGAFQRVLDKSVPAAEWQQSKIWHHAGQEWVLLELHSGAADLHKMLLVTGLGDRMLMMNIESTFGEFPRYEQALRESIESIRFDEAR